MTPKPVWDWFSQPVVCELQRVPKTGEGDVIAKCYFKKPKCTHRGLAKKQLDTKRGKTDTKGYTETSALTTTGAWTHEHI